MVKFQPLTFRTIYLHDPRVNEQSPIINIAFSGIYFGAGRFGLLHGWDFFRGIDALDVP